VIKSSGQQIVIKKGEKLQSRKFRSKFFEARTFEANGISSIIK
jgi:hypothetical protein